MVQSVIDAELMLIDSSMTWTCLKYVLSRIYLHAAPYANHMAVDNAVNGDHPRNHKIAIKAAVLGQISKDSITVRIVRLWIHQPVLYSSDPFQCLIGLIFIQGCDWSRQWPM